MLRPPWRRASRGSCPPVRRTARELALLWASLVLVGCAIVPLEQPRQAESPERAAVPPLPPLPGLPDFDVNPELLSMSPPDYPSTAREARQEGMVFCDVLVDTLSAVREVRVARGVSPASRRRRSHSGLTSHPRRSSASGC
jgi:hypothetical protein